MLVAFSKHNSCRQSACPFQFNQNCCECSRLCTDSCHPACHASFFNTLVAIMSALGCALRKGQVIARHLMTMSLPYNAITATSAHQGIKPAPIHAPASDMRLANHLHPTTKHCGTRGGPVQQPWDRPTPGDPLHVPSPPAPPPYSIRQVAWDSLTRETDTDILELSGLRVPSCTALVSEEFMAFWRRRGSRKHTPCQNITFQKPTSPCTTPSLRIRCTASISSKSSCSPEDQLSGECSRRSSRKKSFPSCVAPSPQNCGSTWKNPCGPTLASLERPID